MDANQIDQSIKYLCLLQEVREREHGVTEIRHIHDETGHVVGIFWRCRYCHARLWAGHREHKEECPYQVALSWRTGIVLSMLPAKEEQ